MVIIINLMVDFLGTFIAFRTQRQCLGHVLYNSEKTPPILWNKIFGFLSRNELEKSAKGSRKWRDVVEHGETGSLKQRRGILMTILRKPTFRIRFLGEGQKIIILEEGKSNPNFNGLANCFIRNENWEFNAFNVERFEKLNSKILSLVGHPLPLDKFRIYFITPNDLARIRDNFSSPLKK